MSICFNSRTPGGVRPERFWRDNIVRGVSIHAPREGCDLNRYNLNGYE